MLVKEIKSLLNEVITEVLNEEEDEKKSDERSIVKLEDTQQLNKTDLNKVAKDIADEFNKSYQSIPEDKLNATLELPMGAITSNVITQIQKRKITTAKGKMQIIPLNIATQKETSSDNQTSAASNLDRYANFQVVPFILANEKGETNIKNFFVAGDLRANSMKQIYTAWNHAVQSADDINGRIRRKKRLT